MNINNLINLINLINFIYKKYFTFTFTVTVTFILCNCINIKNRLLGSNQEFLILNK